MVVYRLETEFLIGPRIGQQVLETACETLLGSQPAKGLQPGQIQVIVTALGASFGPKLAESDRVQVTLTLDNGAEDVQVIETVKLP